METPLGEEQGGGPGDGLPDPRRSQLRVSSPVCVGTVMVLEGEGGRADEVDATWWVLFPEQVLCSERISGGVRLGL